MSDGWPGPGDPTQVYAPGPHGHGGQPGGGGNNRMLIVLAAAVLVLVGAIGAFVAIGAASGSGGSGPDGPGSVGTDPAVAGGQEISVFDLAVGQCLSVDQDAEELEQVGLIGCDQPHTAEVYAVVNHPAAIGAAFPGEAALTDFADEECIARFAGFVGLDYADSRIFSTSLTPTELSWDKSGDREVVCLLISGDGTPLEPGSLRDAGI